MSDPIILSYASPGATEERPLVPMYERVFHFGTGVILPVACFGLSADRYPLATEWQTDEWSSVMSTIPSGPNAWPFYPLLAYTMAYCALAVINPKRWLTQFRVRFALYTGVLLAYQFSFIQCSLLFGKSEAWIGIPIGIVLPLLAACFLLTLGWLVRKIPFRKLQILLPSRDKSVGANILGSVVILVVLIAVLGMSAGALVPTLIAAPILTLTTFIALSRLAMREFAPTSSDGTERTVLPIGWSIGFMAAWVQSVRMAIDNYAQLPTTPPCYIATAAARGHRRFVKAVPVTACNGRIFQANEQLAVLKAFEIGLKALWPEFHRFLRRIYDRIGPLARRLTHPLLADAAYVSLKPAEWFASALLHLAGIRRDSLLPRLYSSKRHGDA